MGSTTPVRSANQANDDALSDKRNQAIEASSSSASIGQTDFPQSRLFEDVLTVLLEAYDFADELRRSTWDFAVDLGALRSLGVVDNLIRYLCCRGYLDHAAEKIPGGKRGRSFRRTGALSLTAKTCVVLTREGAAFARDFLSNHRVRNQHCPRPDPHPNGFAEPVPKYDEAGQRLLVGALIVRQYRLPTSNQQLILQAFQESGWERELRDPLSPHPRVYVKERLRTTVANINRSLVHPAIHFSCNGTGHGVRWKIVLDEYLKATVAQSHE
jgi:hypothetical protein